MPIDPFVLGALLTVTLLIALFLLLYRQPLACLYVLVAFVIGLGIVLLGFPKSEWSDPKTWVLIIIICATGCVFLSFATSNQEQSANLKTA